MSITLTSTPIEDGYRMPAEWETHSGCWLIWPENTDNWRMGAKPVQQKFIEVATTISQYEPVTMCVSPDQYRNARAKLPENIRVVELAHKDAWARDAGPTFLVNDNGGLRGVDWGFNAYGGLEEGLHFPWNHCELAARKILEIEKADRYRPDLIMEGGSIHVDGQGTLVTTEECLLHPNRNPDLSKDDVEQYLKDYLNIEKVIWLKQGLFEDETNGHVDNICCFLAPGIVALAWTDDKNDPQYEISNQCLEILKSERDAQGNELKIVKFPQPKPIIYTEEECLGIDLDEYAEPRCAGDRTGATYLNFYIGNDVVVYPTFDDKNDEVVKQILSEYFPGREIIGIYAREIILGGGNIHCITQQQPK